MPPVSARRCYLEAGEPCWSPPQAAHRLALLGWAHADAGARASVADLVRCLRRTEALDYARGELRGISTDSRYLRRERSGTNFQGFSLRASGSYGEAFKPDGSKKPRETSSI